MRTPSTQSSLAEADSSESRPSFFRRFGAGAFFISVVVHAIFILLAIFVFFHWIDPPKEEVQFLPGGGGGGDGGSKAHQIQTQKRQVSTSMAQAKKVVAMGAASFTLPDAPEMSDAGLPMMASMESSSGSGGGAGGGSGGGLGTGNGKGTGPGSGPGVGKGFISTTPFGSKEARSNALKGYLYDFKQSPEGKPTPNYHVDMQHTEDYTRRVAEAIQKDFRETAFKGYFKAPDALYLTQLAVPITEASEGPRLFGGEGKMQPSGWLAHYHGKLKAPKAMNFRFVAFGDDCVIIKIKGQTRMIAAWPQLRPALFGRWQPSDPDKEFASPWGGGWKMTNGDWINLRAGETFDIDIAVGECPGGHVSFLLLVEEKKENYAHGPDGRPILPIFTTEPVTKENRDRIDRDFAKWGTFDWDKVVVFGAAETDRLGDPLR